MTTALEQATRAAHRLERASAGRTPCAPVRDLIGRDDVESAYAVQLQLNQARLAAGAHVVGRKIGLTSPAVQRQLGVATGSGEACLGDPLDALAWLAKTVLDLGEPLRAGQVVLSGALGPMVPVQPGTQVRAELNDIDGRALGNVTTYSPEEHS